jgi:hypothetical protein
MITTLLAAACLVSQAPADAAGGKGTRPIVYYVATDGDDRWSGRLAAPGAGGTDGPFATLQRARDAVRELKRGAGGVLLAPVTVAVRGGRYELARALEFTPDDSGTAQYPVVYTSYRGETPVLSGGRKIGGWRPETINGHACWVADVAGVRAGDWVFHHLWVGGRGRTRARTPNVGDALLRIEPEPAVAPAANAGRPRGQDRFHFAAGDIKPWDGLADVDVVALHQWVGVRLAVKEVDATERLVTFHGRSRRPLREGGKGGMARYYVENAREFLDAPGEWYLDCTAGRLYYVPEAGEEPGRTEVIAPVARGVLQLKGEPGSGRFVEQLTLRGLTVAHSEWWPARSDAVDMQAAVEVPGAVMCEGTRACRFEDCTVAHVGSYALELGRGCSGNVVTRCRFFDLGAGGVKLGELAIRPDGPERTAGNTVEDCTIQDGGRTFPQAVGVWIGQSADNTVAHNEIAHLNYTGISVGWTWGYGPALATGNRIEANHVHDLGRGLLSDMGGIYTLGLQRGTVIRGNVFHDIAAFNYGGWGIYLDEGTTDIVAENNLVYRTTHGGFHQHYGRDNLVQNNIFAFGRDAQLQRTRVEPHRSFTFERNIVFWQSGPLLAGRWTERNADFDHNLYWRSDDPGSIAVAGRSFDEWQTSGADAHSQVADPLFHASGQTDFALAPASPALALGFQPFPASTAGPRGAEPIVLNDDGGWCWFEGPRALVRGGKLVFGTVAAGRHDPARRGNIEAAVCDLAAGTTARIVLHERLQLDDHDSPALLPMADGRLLAVYARHGPDDHFFYRRSEPDDPTRWGPEGRFTPSTKSRVTYSNLFRLDAENGRVYDFFRGLDGRWKPSYAYSDDGGRSWSTGGVVIESPAARPYVRYASDGTDTIHLIYTEGHPRDSDNSLYHVVYRRGMLQRSDGSVVRALAEGLRRPDEGTRIFQGDADHVAWPCDVALDRQGFPVVAYSVQVGSAGRAPGSGGDDIRYRYARWDGSRWHDQALAFAGTRLYAGEDDYSGLAAIDPDRPDVVYVSTNADPATGAPLIDPTDGNRHYQIFRGTTPGTSAGASWSWSPVTRPSGVDHIRPVLPARKNGRTMLLWLRGRFPSYTDYELEVVGVASDSSE